MSHEFETGGEDAVLDSESFLRDVDLLDLFEAV
jgi:hypothetical protein